MFRPELVSFLKLMQRSPDAGDGWRKYSELMKDLVYLHVKKFPGLFEMDDEKMWVRTTPEGDVLVKWMNFKPSE